MLVAKCPCRAQMKYHETLERGNNLRSRPESICVEKMLLCVPIWCRIQLLLNYSLSTKSPDFDCTN